MNKNIIQKGIVSVKAGFYFMTTALRVVSRVIFAKSRAHERIQRTNEVINIIDISVYSHSPEVISVPDIQHALKRAVSDVRICI